MRCLSCAIAMIIGLLVFSSPAFAAATVYDDETAFRNDAGPTTTYGFEVHGLIEGIDVSGFAPFAAADLDNSFDLALTNFNWFEIVDDVSSVGTTEGTHCVFTHTVYPADNYTLTFSNFGASAGSVAAFGFTITDFASNITDPATITYDTGLLTGTLLSVPGGQLEYTQNFVGVIVDAGEAFTSITITLDDNLSGMQWFDEVIFTDVSVTLAHSETWGSIKSLFR
ncbi:hypothetical protein ACFL6M_00475 [Candidatus Eisenbacteria bacterium]|uniref:PEP-CTERM sorting domain-containing protein n=1 Tax=Eiseniibacteriota bacterium TaxID=2212470 RepID=A0ABV6YI95_UNCEI